MRFAGSHDQCGKGLFPASPCPFRMEEQMMKRGGRQHQADACGIRGENGGQDVLWMFALRRCSAGTDDNGAARGAEQLCGIGTYVGKASGCGKVGNHDGKGFMRAGFATAQLCDSLGIAGVTDQVEASQSADGRYFSMSECGKQQRNGTVAHDDLIRQAIALFPCFVHGLSGAFPA